MLSLGCFTYSPSLSIFVLIIKNLYFSLVFTFLLFLSEVEACLLFITSTYCLFLFLCINEYCYMLIS